MNHCHNETAREVVLRDAGSGLPHPGRYVRDTEGHTYRVLEYTGALIRSDTSPAQIRARVEAVPFRDALLVEVVG